MNLNHVLVFLCHEWQTACNADGLLGKSAVAIEYSMPRFWLGWRPYRTQCMCWGVCDKGEIHSLEYLLMLHNELFYLNAILCFKPVFVFEIMSWATKMSFWCSSAFATLTRKLVALCLLPRSKKTYYISMTRKGGDMLSLMAQRRAVLIKSAWNDWSLVCQLNISYNCSIAI